MRKFPKLCRRTLQRMADDGNVFAEIILHQRDRIKALESAPLSEPGSERIIRDLQLENDKLRAENARLRSHG